MPLLSALRRPFARKDPATVASEFWDHQITQRSVYWTEHPLVREYANSLITGVPWLSPTSALKVGWANRPWKRGLSIGCGVGHLERDLWNLRVCERIDAFDFSRESLRKARQLNRAAGVSGIRYWRDDFNTVRLPRDRYDAVFFHGSLHHVHKLERLFDQVERALHPWGVIYIDEYVGPSRDQWLEETFEKGELAAARAEFEQIPDALKRWPVAAPIEFRDPSEAIRSGEILPMIRERFEILNERPYWGNLLYTLFCCLDGDAMLAGEQRPLVERLIEREKELVASGAYTKPYYAVVLARRR